MVKCTLYSFIVTTVPIQLLVNSTSLYSKQVLNRINRFCAFPLIFTRPDKWWVHTPVGTPLLRVFSTGKVCKFFSIDFSRVGTSSRAPRVVAHLLWANKSSPFCFHNKCSRRFSLSTWHARYDIMQSETVFSRVAFSPQITGKRTFYWK